MSVDDIIAYEQGELGDSDTLKMFGEGIKSGQVWHLQGHYGRTAKSLIDGGYIDVKGNVLV